MGTMGIAELILLLLFVLFVVGVVGGGGFLVVRQMLDRLEGGSPDDFQSRVLDELEVLRVRLDRISERLDAQADRKIHEGPAEREQLPRGPRTPGTGTSSGAG